MNAKMMFIHGLSPIHTGTGQSVDVIDLPIAREVTTGWPFIPGSGIKGVLRDASDQNQAQFAAAFGDKGSAGKLTFSDGRILCLPVRSFYGVFAWVTCPSVLARLKRDYDMIGGGANIASVACPGEKIFVCTGSSLVKDDKVYLEDLDFASERNGSVDSVADFIAGRVFSGDNDWQGMFKARFAVVSDDSFTFLTETCTEVSARININDETGTVKDTALWYEEAIPTESIFWCPLLSTSEVCFGVLPNDSRKPVQFGGSATVGKGLARVILEG